MELNVKISKRVATYEAGDELPICGNTGISVKFELDEEWDAHDKKTARFIWGGKYEDVEFTGDTCEAPVVTNTQSVLVGLYAGELPEDGFMLSSTLCSIAYGLSVRCGNRSASNGTGANYTNEARGYAVSAKESADRAEEAAEQAASGGGMKEVGSVTITLTAYEGGSAIYANDRKVKNGFFIIDGSWENEEFYEEWNEETGDYGTNTLKPLATALHTIYRDSQIIDVDNGKDFAMCYPCGNEGEWNMSGRNPETITGKENEWYFAVYPSGNATEEKHIAEWDRMRALHIPASLLERLQFEADDYCETVTETFTIKGYN